MRRGKQQLTQQECVALLKQEPRGVLSLMGEDGYPYGLPISYWYCEADGKIYFHGAKSGHKIDAIQRCDKASFCVYDQGFRREGEWALNIKSVIVFGRVRVLENEAQMRAAIELLARRYFPQDSAENRHRAIEREWAGLCMLEMDIEHMSGKEAIELARKGGSRP